MSRDRARALESYQQAVAKGNRDAERNLKRLSANQDTDSAAGTQGKGKPADTKTNPPIVESKTKVDEAEPATSATDKAKSTTAETVMSAPPLPRSKGKPLARKSQVRHPSKNAKGKNKSKVASQDGGNRVRLDAGTVRKDRNPSKSGEDCRPGTFRNYAAGRMRPCDYW